MLLGKGMSDSQRYVLTHRVKKKLDLFKDVIPLLWSKFNEELFSIYNEIVKGLTMEQVERLRTSSLRSSWVQIPPPAFNH